ncbi:GtrA family protein [Thiospirochaeta perfilievii]|uniref:GtrA family protein n=1 Tax=Thiospirochaeta perfilievii TaxID=252967 RepID=A0A5C1QF61_9SPIO|nr:GtrA family protein [Thiospirochaeta perfilievii]QEN05689.1 GtrA family protein [Thiospirochaeta perfilievii]
MQIIKQAAKFSIVGLINTGITIGSIFILTKIFSVNYIVANAIGYILGLINSFFLNRSWTFKSRGKFRSQGLRFVLVFIMCYTLQLGLLIILKERLYINVDISQIIGMVFYTGLNFILSKFFTFKKESLYES